MKTHTLPRTALAAALLAAGAAGLDATTRTWTGNNGKTLHARLIGFGDGKVTLEMTKDGKRYSFSPQALVEADRDFLQRWVDLHRATAAPQREFDHSFVSLKGPKSVTIPKNSDTEATSHLGVEITFRDESHGPLTFAHCHCYGEDKTQPLKSYPLNQAKISGARQLFEVSSLKRGESETVCTRAPAEEMRAYTSLVFVVGNDKVVYVMSHPGGRWEDFGFPGNPAGGGLEVVPEGEPVDDYKLLGLNHVFNHRTNANRLQARVKFAREIKPKTMMATVYYFDPDGKASHDKGKYLKVPHDGLDVDEEGATLVTFEDAPDREAVRETTILVLFGPAQNRSGILVSSNNIILDELSFAKRRINESDIHYFTHDSDGLRLVEEEPASP